LDDIRLRGRSALGFDRVRRGCRDRITICSCDTIGFRFRFSLPGFSFGICIRCSGRIAKRSHKHVAIGFRIAASGRVRNGEDISDEQGLQYRAD
jgi:hypothetical protein